MLSTSGIPAFFDGCLRFNPRILMATSHVGEILPKKIRILIVDDYKQIRNGIRSILSAQPDLQIVSEASDGHEAVLLATEHLPDVIVLDISMPSLNGFDAARQIRRVSPKSAILFFSNHGSSEMHSLSLQAGGLGHVPKEDGLRDLVNAIRVVNRGERFFGKASVG
jgi:DNA-binding NarL/FixJ family response regulator